MQSREAIEVIKSRINIADYIRRYIELRPAGSRLMALCPFHQEKSPSFTVNEDQGTFFCYGCQTGGDIFEFSQRINGYEFKEALINFSDELGISITYNKDSKQDQEAKKKSKEKLDAKKMHSLAASHFANNLKKKEAKACNEYIEKRGLSSEIIEQFSLGYSLDAWHDLSAKISSGYNDKEAITCGLLAQSNNSKPYDRFRGRLMFPIFSLTGQVVAFGGRIIPQDKPKEDNERQEAKYINSSDTNIYKKGEHLYGLFQARKAMSLEHFTFLTEGYMDVLTLHQFGFKNAIAVLGTALTETQVKRISGFCSKVELLFDGDTAGRQAAFKSAQMLLLAGLECKVVLFPEKEDIDSLLRQENGLNLFSSLRKEAEEGLSYLIRFKKESSRLEAIKWAKEFLQKVQIPEIISLYASTIATELGIDEAEIRHQVVRNANYSKTVSKSKRQEANKSASLPQNKDLQRDRLIITFAVRYPKSIHRLEELGAGMILKSDFAAQLWNTLVEHQDKDAFHELNSEQKNFWLLSREGDAPPCTDEEGEFKAVTALIKKYHLQAQKQSINAALRLGNTDIETQGEYLNALTEEHKALSAILKEQ